MALVAHNKLCKHVRDVHESAAASDADQCDVSRRKKKIWRTILYTLAALNLVAVLRFFTFSALHAECSLAEAPEGDTADEGVDSNHSADTPALSLGGSDPHHVCPRGGSSQTNLIYALLAVLLSALCCWVGSHGPYCVAACTSRVRSQTIIQSVVATLAVAGTVALCYFVVAV